MGEVDKYRELIEREIVERPISVRGLAKEIKISYQTIYAILHRRYDAIKTTTKLKLDSHFGISREREPTHEELRALIAELKLKLNGMSQIKVETIFLDFRPEILYHIVWVKGSDKSKQSSL